MKKRGQITTFIVIGLLLLLAAGLAVIFRSEIEQRRVETEFVEKPLPAAFEPVRGYVEECMASAIVPGLSFIGSHGGYLDLPIDKAVVMERLSFALGFRDGERMLPTKEMIEGEIGRYAQDAVAPCLEELDIFEAQGYVIRVGEPKKVTTTLMQDAVRVVVGRELAIDYQNETQTIDLFAARVPIRLGHLVDISNRIIDNHIADPASADMDFLAGFDVHVSVLPLDEGIIAYALYDNLSAVDGEPFLFSFAIQDTASNLAPRLGFLPDVVLTKGVPYAHDIDVLDDTLRDTLTFSTDNPTFYIEQDLGTFNFTPTATGEFFVTLRVQDKAGASDERKIRFIVEEPLAEDAG